MQLIQIETWLAENLVLRRYLTDFLIERNVIIQSVAQSTQEQWKKILTSPDHGHILWS